MMDRDVAIDARLRVAVVCAPEILRLGLERVLAQDPALSVRAHRRLEAVRAPADVAVLCERGLADIATACGAAAAALDAGVVVITAGANPHVVLDCLAAGATGFLTEADPAHDLRAASLAAAVGEYHMGPRLLSLLLDWERGERRRPRTADDAERELLGLLAAGHTTARSPACSASRRRPCATARPCCTGAWACGRARRLCGWPRRAACWIGHRTSGRTHGPAMSTQEVETMDVPEVVTQIRDAITVKRAFGDPYERDGIVLIPVARVGGGGGGAAARDRSPRNPTAPAPRAAQGSDSASGSARRPSAPT